GARAAPPGPHRRERPADPTAPPGVLHPRRGAFYVTHSAPRHAAGPYRAGAHPPAAGGTAHEDRGGAKPPHHAGGARRQAPPARRADARAVGFAGCTRISLTPIWPPADAVSHAGSTGGRTA